jgi:flagellar basal body rod protein FlgC
MADEAIRLRQANTLYSTNLKVMKVTDDMMGKFLNDRA